LKDVDMSREDRLFIVAKRLRKTYGPTVAVNNLDIKLYKGEVLALVGANGAGKSTLMNLISGSVPADHGELFFNGEAVNIEKYTPEESRKQGIRVVHQELSLCKNLTVYENFYIEHHNNFEKRNYTWRKDAKAIAREALDAVFPDNSINVNAGLDSLSIAQQQMVEIARALCDPLAKLLILDEPTSSLPNHQTQQLQDYIQKDVSLGRSYIYISHRLQEIIDLANHVYIMQNGQEKYQCHISKTSIDDMVERMGDGIIGTVEKKSDDTIVFEKNSEVKVELNHFSTKSLKDITTTMYGGEIIAVTGLEGNGQNSLITEIFQHNNKKDTSALKISGRIAFVAGDRKKEGIFPLWSIKDNSSITRVTRGPLFRKIKADDVNDSIESWNSRLKTKCASYEDLIVNLSGGNQQKVLIARALASEAEIIILDDPTKGVDVATKNELYAIFRETARNGKLIIWRTSDDTELEYCSRILVMNTGAVAGELDRKELEHSSILKLAFNKKTKSNDGNNTSRIKKMPMFTLSLFSAMLLYSFSGMITPAVFSKFGIELLAVGFTPFIFAALGQTFIVGFGHIDLSVGAFMGLVNVVCATVLKANTFLGMIFLLGLLLVYSGIGLFLYWKKIPSIIVTLSMSFVWIGLAYALQDVPGGEVPGWMITLFNFNGFILQGVLVWLLLAMFGAILFMRSRYGTVLRGFGNNEEAMINSGWSRAKAYYTTYFVAGILVVMGGISQSAITGASDVNASATYTLLTVAAVIIGGGYFIGGRVTLLGTVFGGIALTMISVLLGLMRISTDFTATIQGLVLLIILSARLINRDQKK